MANDFTLNLKAQVNVDDIKKQLREVSKTQKITFDINGIPKATQEISKLQDKAGNAYQEIKKLDGANKTLNTTFIQTAKGAETLGERLEGAGRKLQSINGVFQAVKNAAYTFGQVMQPLLEFDKELTEFKKVSDLSGEALDEYTKKLGAMGAEVARTRAEMVSAAGEYVKSGYSEEDAAILARVTALFQNVADSEIEAGDASSFIISQLKAFRFEANQAENVINAINQVANEFAVSSTDISTGLSKTSAAMAVLGNDFNQTIGLVTAGTELMTGQARLYWSV